MNVDVSLVRLQDEWESMLWKDLLHLIIFESIILKLEIYLKIYQFSCVENIY